MNAHPIPLERIDDHRWRIPRHGRMNVDGLVFASDAMMQAIRGDQSLQQVVNVAHLPGIVGHSIAMPDIHWGYGFPHRRGSGVRRPRRRDFARRHRLRHQLRRAAAGLRSEPTRRAEPHARGGRGPVSQHPLRGRGAPASDSAVAGRLAGRAQARRRLGGGAGLRHAARPGTHRGERLPWRGAEPQHVSQRALERGRPQLGSIGSGNHFVEVDYVAEVYDDEVARALGLFKDQLAITIHTGSRGLGYQVCDDSIKGHAARHAAVRHRHPGSAIVLRPAELTGGARLHRRHDQRRHFAFANRQLITHTVRQTFAEVLQRSARDLRIEVIYDVCHNIGKFETHVVDGEARRLCVHRKGATRALAPGHPQLPEVYRDLGQPVLIPGDMGRYSYVLIGTRQGGEETFASSCHGAGRLMSRTQAKKSARGRPIVRELEDQGIYVRSAGRATLMEEIPEAYKDVRDVVDVVHGAGDQPEGRAVAAAGRREGVASRAHKQAALNAKT